MSEPNMKELFDHHGPVAEPPLRPTLIESSVAGGRRRYRRRLALRTAGGGMAAAVALAVAGGVVSGVTVGEGAAGDSPAGTTARQAETPTAVELLGRISLAAAEERPVKVADDQFIYSKTTITSNPPPGSRLSPVTGTGESWESVDGSQAGWSVGPDKLGRISGHTVAPNPHPNYDPPTYAFLTTLPTDPDALLAEIRAHVAERAEPHPDKFPDPDHAVFEIIGDLISSSVLPPKLGPALYQAAAKIPGVTVVPDVEDAAGRHGIGVTRESTARPPSSERGSGPSVRVVLPVFTWIFDAETYQYLGFRTRDARTGELRHEVAVLEGAVVDEVRQRPE